MTGRTIRPAILGLLVVSATFHGGFMATSAAAQKIADDPSHREAIAYFRAGQELMSAEQFEKAVDEFGKAVERDPLLSIAYYQVGQANMNLRRYASAIKAYKECIIAEQQLYALQETNRFDADKQRNDEIREMRDSVQVLQTLAARFPNSGYQLKATQAEQHLHDLETQRLSTGRPFQVPAQVLLALGSAYFRNDDRDAAEAQWRAAIDADPKLGEAHNNMAVIYMQTGRFNQALAELSLAEKAGFKVNPQFKADLKARATAKR